MHSWDNQTYLQYGEIPQDFQIKKEKSISTFIVQNVQRWKGMNSIIIIIIIELEIWKNFVEGKADSMNAIEIKCVDIIVHII